MTRSTAQVSPLLPGTFNAALRFLRKRAQLTQDELGRAVGYSHEQIARLENGSRLPDLVVIAALFIPALLLEHESPLVEQFLNLAGKTHTHQTRNWSVKSSHPLTLPPTRRPPRSCH